MRRDCFHKNQSADEWAAANATKRLRQFRNRSHFSGDAKRIYEKTYYSHAPSVVSTVTPLAPWKLKVQIGTNHLVQLWPHRKPDEVTHLWVQTVVRGAVLKGPRKNPAVRGSCTPGNSIGYRKPDIFTAVIGFCTSIITQKYLFGNDIYSQFTIAGPKVNVQQTPYLVYSEAFDWLDQFKFDYWTNPNKFHSLPRHWSGSVIRYNRLANQQTRQKETSMNIFATEPRGSLYQRCVDNEGLHGVSGSRNVSLVENISSVESRFTANTPNPLVMAILQKRIKHYYDKFNIRRNTTLRTNPSVDQPLIIERSQPLSGRSWSQNSLGRHIRMEENIVNERFSWDSGESSVQGKLVCRTTVYRSIQSFHVEFNILFAAQLRLPKKRSWMADIGCSSVHSVCELNCKRLINNRGAMFGSCAVKGVRYLYSTTLPVSAPSTFRLPITLPFARLAEASTRKQNRGSLRPIDYPFIEFGILVVIVQLTTKGKAVC
ncbi:hypothetical protein CLF_106528 [Clonorchis sinensis]|uniref:Uncharacterized protein n=1 Tax=Clonorchis sinensis TaxID=79923 RepID=G7YFA7_CLOSI|nr:hypothetical protein CLF_106528 [Clonorchis sinensis]